MLSRLVSRGHSPRIGASGNETERGRAMGVEVMERKKGGRLKGWFNVSCLSVSVAHSTTCGGATYPTHAAHASKIYGPDDVPFSMHIVWRHVREA